MYIDSSRVQQLVVFSQIAGSGSAEEREAADTDARLFVEVAWAAATPAARSAFVQAMQGAGAAMPWSALRAQPEGAPMRAPPAMELVLGGADLGDEGTPAYRVDALTAEGVKMVAALREWTLPVIAAISTPAGWRLDRIDSPVMVGTIGVVTNTGTKGQSKNADQDKGVDDGQGGDQGGTVTDDGQGTSDGSSSEAQTAAGGDSSIAPRGGAWELPRWGWIVGGLALAGGIGLSFVMREKE